MYFQGLDHIGWITKDIDLFEQFWCDVLGYERVKSNEAPVEMMNTLFGTQGATINRYQHPTKERGPDLEIHYFPDDGEREDMPFSRYGINHICLLVGGPGSREEFLAELPKRIKCHVYNNPGGWKNIFIKDYEGNWVELREWM